MDDTTIQTKVLEDGGMGSRKLIVVLIGMGLMSLALVGSALWPALGALYAIYCGGISSLILLYLGGNIAGKAFTLNALPDQYQYQSYPQQGPYPTNPYPQDPEIPLPPDPNQVTRE